MEEEDQQKLPDLVKALAHHLLSQNLPLNSPPLYPNSPKFCNSLRILSIRFTPFVTPNATTTAIVDSILEVEPLVAELVGVWVDKDKLVGENLIKFIVSKNVEEKGR